MKRKYKNKKALTAAIVLALTLGMPGGVYAAEVDLSNAVYTKDDKLIQAAHDTTYATEIANGQNIKVSMTNTDGGAIGLRVMNGKLIVGLTDTESVNIYAKGTPKPYGDAYGALVINEPAAEPALSIEGGNIDITAESGGNAIDMLAGSLSSPGNINLGGSSTQVATVHAATTGEADYEVSATAIRAVNQGKVSALAENLTVTAEAAGTGNTARGIAADFADHEEGSGGGGQITAHSDNLTIEAAARNGANAYGIDAYGGGQVTLNGSELSIMASAEDGEAHGIYVGLGGAAVTIDSQNTTIEATSKDTELPIGAAGIEAANGGKVTAYHNISINPNATDPYKTTAIYAHGGGKVDLTRGTVAIRGNILTDGNQGTEVSVFLKGKDSSWTGNAINVGTGSGLILHVDNGAHWTADGSQRPTEEGYEGTAVNTLRSLDVNEGGTVQVGGTLTILERLQEDRGASVQADTLKIGGQVSNIRNSTLNVNHLALSEHAALEVRHNSTVIVNGSIEGGFYILSDGGSTVTLSNLTGTLPQMNLMGTTNYYLGDNDWENPKTLNAANLIVDPSGMDIAGTAGLRPGATVRKRVLANHFEDEEQGDGTQGAGSSAPRTKLVNSKQKHFVLGTTLQGTEGAELEGNDVYYKVDVSGNAQPQTHSAVMGQVAGLTTVANGFDYINKAVDNGMEERGFNVFAAVGGGENKYDTGSHIKTNDWHAVAGVGVKNERDNGSSTTYGIFYDYGNGRYRTFQDAGYGSGKAIYRGGGLFGKYTAPSKFYVEGSFRAGRVENSANGIFHDYFGNRYSLKTNSDYNAFHVGVGKIYRLDDNDNLDVYGKFFHTHVSGDSFNAGGHYDIDGVDSDILRVGTRWNHKQGDWNHYLGLAYEYEFDGEAKGTADGARIRSADIGGSSVRFELGTNVETGKWVLGASASAYAGQHQGFGGNITAAYKF